MTPYSQAENEEIIATIRSHRANGRFFEAERLIDSLPKDKKASGSIAIEIIQLFIAQGYSRAAAQFCDEAFPPSPLHAECAETVSTIESEETAVLDILRAFVGILRYSKLQTALKIAQRLGSAWKLADDEYLQHPILPNTRALADDSAQLESGPFQSWDVQAREMRGHNLTEYNVLLRFFYWNIQIVAAEQGLLDQKSTKAAAELHISALRRTLQSAGRIREARFLIYLEVGVITDPNRALNELEDFLLLLSEPRWETEKAMTLADIAGLQLKSTEEPLVAKAKHSLNEAQQLFIKLDHRFGAIDLDLIRVSADSSTSAGEKFVLKSGIADRYFQIGHYQNGIRCLAFAISPEMILDRYSEHVMSALELLQRKIVETGSEILNQLALIHSISQAALKAPEYGFALQTMESCYANVPAEIGPTFHSSMAMMLSITYASFDRHEEALQAAEESLTIAMTGMDYEIQSDAAFMVGCRKFGMWKVCGQDPAKSEKYLNSAKEILAKWADKDAENGYVSGESQKCLQIGNWDFLNANLHPETARASHQGQLWIERVRKHIPESADALKRSQLVDLEVKTLMLLEDYPAALKMTHSYLEDVKKIAFASPMAKAQALFSTSLLAELCASIAIKSGKLTSDDAMHSAWALTWSSMDLASQALQLYRQTNGIEPIFSCTLVVWDFLTRLVTTMEEDRGRELLRLFMIELNQTEKICDDMRRSVVPTKGLASLMNKRLLVAKEASVRLYGIGVDLAMCLDDVRGAWEWLQRGKARAFSDSLGPGFLIPPQLMQKINADQEACDLLNTEQSALEALSEPGANYVITARRLASVRSRMADNALLAEISKIRDGMLSLDINTHDINAALSSTGIAPDRVNFVDWSISTTNQAGSLITLFVRKLDGETKAKQLPVSLTEVKAWLSKAFNYKLADPPLSKKTGNRFLNTMSGLLDGLSEMTQEDDLLILSPSGVLNRVPLHALSVDGKPLIERNLVVYSSSAALLSQCLNRSNSAPDSPPVRCDAKDEATFFAVFEEPSRKAERELIFDHVQSLASTFPGSASLGPEVTRPHFLEKASTSRWVHYHGHAHYTHEDVLKASLVLSDGKDLFSGEVEAGNPGLGEDELSVPDLFKARLPRTGGGVHFTVIACDSGTQDYAPGDEPMGLIPALLYAGATSVLGCQWPVLSAAGRAFSKAFYETISLARTQSTNGGSNVIHIAQAMRSTISDMRAGKLDGRYKQPYYWASFALHGLWFHARQQEESR